MCFVCNGPPSFPTAQERGRWSTDHKGRDGKGGWCTRISPCRAPLSCFATLTPGLPRRPAAHQPPRPCAANPPTRSKPLAVLFVVQFAVQFAVQRRHAAAQPSRRLPVLRHLDRPHTGRHFEYGEAPIGHTQTFMRRSQSEEAWLRRADLLRMGV